MTNKEAINWLINLTADIGKSEHHDLWHYEQALYEIRDMLQSLDDKDTDVPSKDTIYRQDAIDALGNEPELWEDPYSLSEDYSKGQREQWNNDREVLLNLPSAEARPVVRCPECEYWDERQIRCNKHKDSMMYGVHDFCSKGKRKGTDDE